MAVALDARSQYFRLDQQASNIVSDLHEIAVPAVRADLLDDLASHETQLAELAVPAFGRSEKHRAAAQRESARLLRVLATCERARAAGAPRPPSDWSKLEDAAGPILDDIADPLNASHIIQAEMHVGLQAATKRVLSREASEILCTLECSLHALATLKAQS